MTWSAMEFIEKETANTQEADTSREEEENHRDSEARAQQEETEKRPSGERKRENHRGRGRNRSERKGGKGGRKKDMHARISVALHPPSAI